MTGAERSDAPKPKANVYVMVLAACLLEDLSTWPGFFAGNAITKIGVDRWTVCDAHEMFVKLVASSVEYNSSESNLASVYCRKGANLDFGPKSKATKRSARSHRPLPIKTNDMVQYCDDAEIAGDATSHDWAGEIPDTCSTCQLFEPYT